MKPGMKFSRLSKSVQAKSVSSPANSARKALLRRIQRQELRKLQSMLPGSSRARLSASRQSEDPCAVIHSVIDYIDSLHATILARVRQGTLPPDVLEQLNLKDTVTLERNSPLRSKPQ